MVQTRAAAQRVESGQEPYVAAPVPSSKKRRVVDGSESPKKRRRGKERELCQLNLDVLFLLAGYLHPLDLLNLARTCKSLRELLMDKSSTFVWKTARGQVKGLPDCPVDLTEPEYANLLFYTRCHGCGKYAKKILWGLRRRYCPDCRQQRLCYYSSCPAFILYDYILPMESFAINGERAEWVDKEQLQSLIQEYDCSSDKEQFVKEKRERRGAIFRHATECRDWEWYLASERRSDLDLRRQERYDSIFERLKHEGYEREIVYFGQRHIRQHHKRFFRTSKPLTDKEWAQMLPEWLETMNKFKSERVESLVCRPRRDLLTSAYVNYLASSSSTPVSDLLPHVSDVARFPPFRDIINAPEGAQLGVPLFESALAQLPALVEEWRKPLEIKLANLVQIPPHLSSPGASGDNTTSSCVTHTEPSQSAADKLRLACAVFDTGSNILCRYPGVFSSSMRRVRLNQGNDSQGPISFQDRFGIKLLEEAPRIVHACGLDPNAATVEDMDRRNARLRCLSCAQPWVRSWRNALFHARYCHQPPAPPAFWQLIGDEHIEAIHNVEQPVDELYSPWMRCLLCVPSVGDAMFQYEVNGHLVERHGMDEDAIRLGEHYGRVCMDEPRNMAEMEEVEGRVVFKHIPF